MFANKSIADELQMRHDRTTVSVRHWCARAATGASVIRVFVAGTKDRLLPALISVPIEKIPALRGREPFEHWFEDELERLTRAIRHLNRDNSRVQPGLKWGHCAKVLSLFLRDVVVHSRFFSDNVVAKVKPWLFAPVDSRVIDRLADLGVRTPFDGIREIATRDDFYFVQNLLIANCGPGIARVTFDDVWADRD